MARRHRVRTSGEMEGQSGGPALQHIYFQLPEEESDSAARASWSRAGQAPPCVPTHVRLPCPPPAPQSAARTTSASPPLAPTGHRCKAAGTCRGHKCWRPRCSMQTLIAEEDGSSARVAVESCPSRMPARQPSGCCNCTSLCTYNCINFQNSVQPHPSCMPARQSSSCCCSE